MHAHAREGARKSMRGFYWVIEGWLAGCPRPGGRERGNPFESKKAGLSEEGDRLDDALTWLEEHGVGAVLSMTERPLSSIRTENRVKPQSVYKQTVVTDENLTHFVARKVERRAGVE
jgi:hypothetical protein